jgi:hypothetical protein
VCYKSDWVNSDLLISEPLSRQQPIITNTAVGYPMIERILSESIITLACIYRHNNPLNGPIVKSMNGCGVASKSLQQQQQHQANIITRTHNRA